MNIETYDLARVIGALTPPSAPEYCLFLQQAWWACMTKAEWSGWVQAIGSILAIGGAWWGIVRQLQHAEAIRQNDRDDRDSSHARKCLYVAEDARRALRFMAKTMRERFEEGEPVNFGPERLAEVQLLVRSALERELPEALSTRMLVVQRQIAFSIAAQRLLRGGRPLTERRVNLARTRFQRVSRIVRELRAIDQG